MGHRSTLASLSSNWGQCLIVQTYLASGARPLLLLRPRAFLRRNERWPWTWLSPKKTPVPHTSVSDSVKKGWATHCLFILLSRNLTCFSCFVKQHLLCWSDFRPSALYTGRMTREVEAHWYDRLDKMHLHPRCGPSYLMSMDFDIHTRLAERCEVLNLHKHGLWYKH